MEPHSPQPFEPCPSASSLPTTVSAYLTVGCSCSSHSWKTCPEREYLITDMGSGKKDRQKRNKYLYTRKTHLLFTHKPSFTPSTSLPHLITLIWAVQENLQPGLKNFPLPLLSSHCFPTLWLESEAVVPLGEHLLCQEHLSLFWPQCFLLFVFILFLSLFVQCFDLRFFFFSLS